MRSYNDAFNSNMQIFEAVSIEKYPCEFHGYRDPDRWAVSKEYAEKYGYEIIHGHVTQGGVKCTADAILSVKRIRKHEKGLRDFIDAYELARKDPILFFPSERGGINSSRFLAFGDRVDFMLLDLKQCCESQGEGGHLSAYKKEKTKKWLQSFDYDFNAIVSWMHLDGSFVDKGEIVDLEKGDGTHMKSFSRNRGEWSSNYYKNVKNTLKKWRERNKEILECEN